MVVSILNVLDCMTRKPISYRSLLTGFSPWIILGVAAVLLPIMAMMTLENINRQREQGIHLMTEKGAALIRSFAAGTRFGMRGGHGSGFQLQRLLVETAAQSDIAYLYVVNTDGAVIAHSQSDRIGMIVDTDLDLASLYQADTLFWRRTKTADGAPVFEVYGKFAPLTRRRPGPVSDFRKGMHDHHQGMMKWMGDERAASQMIIFVGFLAHDLDAAHAANVRHTVLTALILLLAGCAGVVTLFLAQNYRAARTRLVQVQAFSDNLVSRMPIGLVALDRDGRVTAINTVAETILGIDQAVVIGEPAGAVLPVELADMLSLSDGVVERELRCPVAGGRLIPLDVSAAHLFDTEGTRFGQVILFKDLSEIRALRQELEKNRRLASVGRLAAGVAHEIRNPLSSIKGFATYFKEKYQDQASDQEIATIMIQEVERLNRVVGQLLEFSRPLSLHIQRIDVKLFLVDTLRLIEGQATDQGVEVHMATRGDGLAVDVDQDKMSQVLLNLYLNALDAMSGHGGRLAVAADEGRDGMVRIRVMDSGAGIGSEHQPHIFEPYFSTKKTGTGLGLAIVHNIVKAHGGEILVESRIGEGTTIEIVLPPAKES